MAIRFCVLLDLAAVAAWSAAGAPRCVAPPGGRWCGISINGEKIDRQRLELMRQYAGRDPANWRSSVRWRGFNVLPDAPAGTIPPGHGYRNPQEFREDDFQMMQDWGMNFARIPLDYRYWIKDGNPWEFDESAMGYIDRLIALGRRHGIHVMLNFHRAPGYMVARPVSETGDVWNDPKMQTLCARYWAYFARRYRNVPNEDLSFNLFNEPPDMDDAQYGKVARIMIDAIRREDPKRFVVSDGLALGARPCKFLFGIRSHVPHGAMLAWVKDNLELWQERGWGWAVWGLHRDIFGCMDNGRTDVPLEDYRGHRLDRAFLEMLRAH